jgi:anti-sigma factor RsiW
VSACRDHELLVSLAAAGALAPDEATQLEAHLAGCPACRAELEASAKALGLARMPPASRAEQRLMAELPERMIEEVRRGDRRRGLGRRFAIGAAVAAVFAVALLVPARFGLHDGVDPRPPQEIATNAGQTELASAATAGSTWQEPDLDTVWQETDLVDFAADSDTGDGTGAEYAATSWAE